MVTCSFEGLMLTKLNLMAHLVSLFFLDGNKSKKGFDFSVASPLPQSIFDSVSPPAAFGSVDTSCGAFMSESRLDQGPDSGAMFPTMLDEMADDTRSNSGTATPEKPHKIVAAEKTVESSPEKSTDSGKSKSSRAGKSGFSALQKWLQLGSNSSGDSALSTSQNSEVSKSLVKERVSALTADRIKSVSSATQTSPDEVPITSTLMPAPAQFSIGSAGPCQGLGFVAGPGAKPSPKMERKHKGGSARSRSGRRDRDRPKSPQRLNGFPVITRYFFHFSSYLPGR